MSTSPSVIFLPLTMLTVSLIAAPAASKFDHQMRPAVKSPVGMAAPSRDLRSAYGHLPLHFEPNVGQFDARVRYAARGTGETLFLTDSELVLALHRAPIPGQPSDGQQAVVRMKLAGGRKPSQWVSGEKQAGISNYFVGNDPTKWRTGVPNYGRVEARDVYPGVDLVCYGNQGQFEYDLNVAPWADASQVQLAWEGADSVRVNAAGDLVLSTRLGDVVQKRPRVYQEFGGRKVEVASRYVLTPDGKVRIELASYDHGRRLSIDPTVQDWTFNLDGSADDYGYGIAVDSAGSVYIAGQSYSTDVLPASTLRPPYGGMDVIIVKLASDGSGLVYSTYLGGSGDERANGIAVDLSGSAYVTGLTLSLDFPAVETAVPSGVPVGGSGFVAKLSPSGNALPFSTYLDSGHASPQSIAVNAAGMIYVAGGGGIASTVGYVPFVIAMMPQWPGGALYSSILNKAGGIAWGVALDGAGAVYVTGYADASPSDPGANDFPISPTAFQTKINGSINAFVAKLSSSLMPIYGTYLGGMAQDVGRAVAVDASGAVFVTGQTSSPDFPTKSPYMTGQGGWDAFVTKLTPDLSALVYSTYLGGADDEFGIGIAVDRKGSAYVIGDTQSPSIQGMGAASGSNAFLTGLSPDGQALVKPMFLPYTAAGKIAVNGTTAFVTGTAPGRGVYGLRVQAINMGPVYGPLWCNAGTSGMPQLRTEGITELLGDIDITCTGGTPTDYGAAIPKTDVVVTLNAPITNRTFGGAWSDVYLVINDPMSGASGSVNSEAVCSAPDGVCAMTATGDGGADGVTYSGTTALPNIFMGTVSGNKVTFPGVPIDPPGVSGKFLTLRVTGIRVNASSVAGGSPVMISAAVSAGDSTVLPVSGGGGSIGMTGGSPAFQLRTADGSAAGSALSLTACGSASQSRFATLRFQEGSATGFTTRESLGVAPFVDSGTSPAPVPQNIPGSMYGGYGTGESSFYNPALTGPPGSLATAGLADFGTRVKAVFTGIPAGVSLWVSTLPVTFTGGAPSANTTGTVARLTASESGAFSPVAPSTTLDGVPAAALSVVNGSAMAVWEVLDSAPYMMENLDFPVWTSYSIASAGTATVSASYAPISNAMLPDPSAAIPRFTGTPAPVTLLQSAGCPHASPITVQTNPAGLGIVVDGVSYTAPQNFNWMPGSSHSLSVASPQGSGATRYAFTNWNDTAGTVDNVVTPSSAATYTATFVPQYRLSTSVTPGAGTIVATPAASDGYYNSGASVQLTAVPYSGYSFASFVGDLSGAANPQSVTMTAPHTVSATYTAAGGGPIATLATASVTEDHAAGTGTVMLTMNPASATWTAQSNTSWLHMAAGSASGTGSQLIAFNLDANGAAEARVGTLTIAGLTLTVTQAGMTYARIAIMGQMAGGGLTNPSGVAVDGAGNLYIADTGNSAIRKLTVGSQVSTPLVTAGLDHPAGVAVDAGGNVYIADTGNNALKEWTVSNQQVTTLVSSGLTQPHGLAVDSQGTVYVANTGGNSIVAWSPSGQLVGMAVTGRLVGETRMHAAGVVATGLSGPEGVAVDGAGNLYIADTGNHAVEKWDVTNQHLNPLISGLNSPGGVAVDAQGNVYVSDAGTGGLTKWDAATQQTSLFVNSGLSGPAGLAADRQGNVYVADSGNNAAEIVRTGYLSLGATSRSEPAAAGSDSIATQVIPASLPVTAVSDQTWLTVGGVANGALAFSFAANLVRAGRSAHITVMGQQITVSQAADSACDVNLDGTTTVVDLQRVVNEASAGASGPDDVNGDGKVDSKDVLIVLKAVEGLGCVTQ